MKAEIEHSLKMMKNYIYETEFDDPSRENDSIIENQQFDLMNSKQYEEMRHKTAIQWMQKPTTFKYKSLLEAKMTKRDRIIKESKYPYKHLIYSK